MNPLIRKLLYKVKFGFSSVEVFSPVLPSLDFLDFFKLQPKNIDSCDLPSKSLSSFLQNPSISKLTPNEIQSLKFEISNQCQVLIKNPKTVPDGLEFPLQLLKSFSKLELPLENPLNLLKTVIQAQSVNLSLMTITHTLLELQEILSKSLEQIKKNEIFVHILNLLTVPLKNQILKKSKGKQSNSGLFLLQILYILVRFDYSDDKFYEILLPEVRKNNSLEDLLEIQLTSLILSLCRLEKKFPGILQRKNDLFQALEVKILHRIKEDSLTIPRIPHIFHCYASLELCPKETKSHLFEILLANINSLCREDIGSLIYSAHKLGMDDEEDLGWKLLLKFREFLKKSPEQVTVVELMNSLIAMRKQKKDLGLKEEIVGTLKKKFNGMSVKSKLVFLYEIAIKQRILNKQEFSDSPYSLFIKQVDLETLNNFDLLTLGSILNVVRSQQNQFETEITKLLNSIKKRKFIKEIEKTRCNKLLNEIAGKSMIFKRKTGFLMRKT